MLDHWQRGLESSSQHSCLSGGGSKQVRRKLVRVLQDKIEKIRVKQISKREAKHRLKLERTNQHTDKSSSHQEIEPIVTRDVLIRLKPLTDASKEFITKNRKKNSLLQFRLKVAVNPVTANSSSSSKTVRDIIKFVCNKWELR